MGADSSRHFHPAQVATLEEETHFTVEEIHKLHRRFVKVSEETGEDRLTRELFEAEMDHMLKGNARKKQIVAELFNAYDADSSGELDFREYLIGLSIITRGTVAERIALAFNMVDTDHSGDITPEEFKGLLTRLAIGGDALTFISKELDSSETSLSKEARQQIIDNFVEDVFDEFDTDRNGVLDYQEFERAVKASAPMTNLEKHLTLATN